MREVPKKRKKKNNKAVFAFVIILILLTVFLASFIISYNLMNKDKTAGDTQDPETKVTDDYEQPKDMLGGSKSNSEDVSSLKLENAELKSKVSSLESENAELRRENQALQATIDNQKYVNQHSSQSSQSSSSQVLRTKLRFKQHGRIGQQLPNERNGVVMYEKIMFNSCTDRICVNCRLCG